MTNNTIVGLVIAVIIIGGGAWYFTKDKEASNTSNEVATGGFSGTVPVEDSTGNPIEVPNVGIADGPVKDFAVLGDNYSFSIKEIKVKKGDTVKIVFTNKNGFHDWVIDEFNARTGRIAAGKTETITFVADKIGTFEYYCSVGNHRANGMKGKLVVE